ncbi:MAG: enoyl-CoA hydratase/isomerase family protein [Propioniciclava sp.]
MDETVYAETTEEHISTLVLNQPRKKNAISAPMMVRLGELLRDADADDEVRVVILRGEGENFSSGGDLRQTPPELVSIENTRATLRPYLELIRQIRRMSKPVIAQVDGYAVGGAFSLMLACDLACVSDRVCVVPAFCQIGIVPEMGLAKFLPQLVGDKLAKELLFTNRVLDSEELLGYRLVNRVLPAGELSAGTLALAREVAAMPPLSIQVTKNMVNAAYDSGLDATLEAESTASPFCANTAAFTNRQE